MVSSQNRNQVEHKHLEEGMSNAAIAALEGSHPKAPPQDKEMTGWAETCP